jgi:hypothetical protein
MGPKIIKNVTTEIVLNKPKRGRKSKKELMESLYVEPINKNSNNKTIPNDKTFFYENSVNNVINSNNNIDSQLSVNLNISEIQNQDNVEKMYGNVLDTDTDTNTNNIDLSNVDDNELNKENNIEFEKEKEGQKTVGKKRGRKPKGGKIVQNIISDQQKIDDKPNVILHLKCSMKDLLLQNQNNYLMDSYTFGTNKTELSFDIIGSENANTNNYTDKPSTTQINNDFEVEDELLCKDTNKEIWKKLKHLEHNLHINNVNNKRSACFWDTCEFDNPPIYIPKHFINGSYHVYGCFCSPECGVAYLMNESIDSSTKFERYHLFNHIYTKIYDYKKNIKPAPNPYYMLEKYYGNLSIQEYRSLLRNERLFLIVDKPLTRILPELHEDNDDFILNNKIIPSNYQVKTRLQRKKQNKTSILNEKFGITNQSSIE